MDKGNNRMSKEHPLSDDICPFCGDWRVRCRGGGTDYTSFTCMVCKKSYERIDKSGEVIKA